MHTSLLTIEFDLAHRQAFQLDLFARRKKLCRDFLARLKLGRSGAPPAQITVEVFSRPGFVESLGQRAQRGFIG
jgi:hypothetical protein